MIEPTRHLGFDPKLRQHLLAGEMFGMNPLECDLATKLLVGGSKNLSQSPLGMKRKLE